MRHGRRSGWRGTRVTPTLMVVITVAVVSAVLPASAAPGATTRVSVANDGSQVNGGSGSPSISADGKAVVFASSATNLVPGDTNNAFDIFLRDLAANTTTRVSVANDGSQANGGSFSPSISADGKAVVFESSASNLVPGDTNDAFDIFVRDLVANTTTRVSVANDGSQGNGNTFSASINADGTAVAFDSRALNLVPNDTNNAADIFVRNLAANTTTRVSVGANGTQGDRESGLPSISAAGTRVAFRSLATNLVPQTLPETTNFADVFVRDLVANTTTQASVAPDGSPGNGDSSEPSLSADGTDVAFGSLATNLVPQSVPLPLPVPLPGSSRNFRDIFVRDLVANTTTQASVAPDGSPANNDSFGSTSLSADGTDVAFGSFATNLVPGDTNNREDLFVRDLVARTTTRESVATDGAQANGNSPAGSLSADGTDVAFGSNASNLVPGDTNQDFDVFVHELQVADSTTTTTVAPTTTTTVAPTTTTTVAPTTTTTVAAPTTTTTVAPTTTTTVAPTTTTTVAAPTTTTTVGDTTTTSTTVPGNNPCAAATITGTEGGETIMGTSGDDVIDARGGDDFVIGGGGNDVVCGGAGNDSLDGRAGNDRIFGGDGNDSLIGGADNDSLNGDAGNDTLSGDAGDDALNGGNDNDTLRGGAGNDTSTGGNGDDTVSDGVGNDVLSGDAGNDTLRGGDGDDDLTGGDDNDRLLGEAGNDTLDGGSGDDNLNGGDGTDDCTGGVGTNSVSNCEAPLP
jgi:Ca2+-binding RTX toxin-like protein